MDSLLHTLKKDLIKREDEITSPFGYRNHPISGEKLFHKRIYIVKEHQSSFHAFTEEVVLCAGYGNVVLIKDKKKISIRMDRGS